LGACAASIGVGLKNEDPIQYGDNKESVPPEDGSLSFQVSSMEILRFAPNGDIYVKGKLVDNDKAVVNGFREWLDEATKKRPQQINLT
jgi:hypothetical protein